jgi:type IV secretion system protein VirB5
MKMKHMFLAMAGVACTAGAPCVHAQWAVIDVGAIAQMVEELAVMQDQLTTARNQFTKAEQQFEALTGQRGMERLLPGINRNYLPTDWTALQDALRGAQSAYSALGAQVQNAMKDLAVLTPTQTARLGSQQQDQLEAERRRVALLQTTTREALQQSSQRFSTLQGLINAIPTATDTKAVMDLQARIGAEQAMLQNENTKLMMMNQTAEAERQAQQQREREQAISNFGSLRQASPIGLNR